MIHSGVWQYFKRKRKKIEKIINYLKISFMGVKKTYKLFKKNKIPRKLNNNNNIIKKTNLEVNLK